MTESNLNESLPQKLVVQATIKDFWLAVIEMGLVMKQEQTEDI